MLILASGSAARRAMLAAAGVRFRVEAAAIDEDALFRELAGEPAARVAERLATAKAQAVAARHAEAAVLGADSVLQLAAGELWQKPRDLAELARQLWALRGRAHCIWSAAVGVRGGAIAWSHVARARLAVREFRRDWLDYYVRECGTQMLASVGGYHVEGLGAQLFTEIEGDQFVVRGLPLLPVLGWLRDIGELPA